MRELFSQPSGTFEHQVSVNKAKPPQDHHYNSARTIGLNKHNARERFNHFALNIESFIYSHNTFTRHQILYCTWNGGQTNRPCRYQHEFTSRTPRAIERKNKPSNRPPRDHTTVHPCITWCLVHFLLLEKPSCIATGYVYSDQTLVFFLQLNWMLFIK